MQGKLMASILILATVIFFIYETWHNYKNEWCWVDILACGFYGATGIIGVMILLW
jgi:hypothetical protein